MSTTSTPDSSYTSRRTVSSSDSPGSTKPGERRIEAGRKTRRAAEQTAFAMLRVAMGDQHDHRRVAAREVLGVADLTAADMAALHADRGAAADAAVAVPAVPERERPGVGAPAGLLGGQPGADRTYLDEPATARRGTAEIGGEQRGALLLAQEKRLLGQRLAQSLDRQDLRARLVVRADQNLEPGHQDHPAARVGAARAQPVGIQPAMAGAVEPGPGVPVRRRVGQAVHRLSLAARPAELRPSADRHQP